MKVAELIQILQTKDPTAHVIISGHSDGSDYEPMNGVSEDTVFEKMDGRDWSGLYTRSEEARKYSEYYKPTALNAIILF